MQCMHTTRPTTNQRTSYNTATPRQQPVVETPRRLAIAIPVPISISIPISISLFFLFVVFVVCCLLFVAVALRFVAGRTCKTCTVLLARKLSSHKKPHTPKSPRESHITFERSNVRTFHNFSILAKRTSHITFERSNVRAL